MNKNVRDALMRELDHAKSTVEQLRGTAKRQERELQHTLNSIKLHDEVVSDLTQALSGPSVPALGD